MKPDKHGNPPLQSVDELYTIFLETLREVTSGKTSFSPKEFSKCLAAREDVRQIIEFMQSSHQDSKTKESPAQLKSRIDVLTKERKKLHTELETLKKEWINDKDFQLRFAVALVRLSQRLNSTAFLQIMKKNQELLQKDTPLKEREKILAKLKKQLAQSEQSPDDDSSTISPTLTLPKIDSISKDILQRFKDSLLEDISEARAIIGEDPENIFISASQNIWDSDDIEFIYSQYKKVFRLILDYISYDQSEKEKVTVFIKEISIKLINLERAISQSHSNNQEYHKDNAEFHKKMGDEISSVSEAVKKHDTIEELKSAVLSGFERISLSLKERQELDIDRLEKGDNEHIDLKANFEQVLGSLLEQNKILKEQSRTDPLTGIFNRRVFEERITGELERFSRYKTPFSLILFDVDNFKGLNDKFGHEAGDRAMKAITSTVKNHIRKTDIFARYGGDEFILILTQTDIAKSVKVAEKLRDMVQKTSFGYKGKQVPITISMGVTEVKNSDKDKEGIITRADKLLYNAKESGRNKVVSDNNGV